MGWLDGLRAVAALLVVYAHLSRYLFRDVRAVSGEWLHAGPAGVMLFFLVSGYIIPASLERRGSLRSFWISRACRLVPLYLVVIAAVLLLAVAGVARLDPALTAHPVTAAVAHATMLPFLLGVPPVTPVLWTLTFEMAFYLLVSALFALSAPPQTTAPMRIGTQSKHARDALAMRMGTQSRRARGAWVMRMGTQSKGALTVMVTVGLAALAVVTAPLSAGRLAGPAVVAVTAVGLVAGLAALVSGRRGAVRAGGLLLGAGVLVLLLAGQDRAHVWDGLLILAVMFAGTTIYRADHGQVGWWAAGAALAVVAAALLVNWFAELRALDGFTPQYRARSVITLLVFGGAFAIGMLTRHRRTPRPLAWLGLVSYSIYLTHYVLIQVFGPLLTRLADGLPAIGEIAVGTAYLGLVCGLSALTHRFVEVPGQRLGRRLIARFGESPHVAHAGAD
jgi:peptidoglycan/LPS O-acetylase OafA/YrhL